METEKGLQRSNKIVEDTIQVATATAETLNAQTEQLERTLDNLDKIEFSLKHVRRVIRDITRGLATDKCAHGTRNTPAFVMLDEAGAVSARGRAFQAEKHPI